MAMGGKVIIVLVGIFALFSGIEAQIGLPCHSSFFQFTARHSLNTSQYMGEWYMHEIAGSHIGNFPEPDYKCATRSLSLPNNTDLLNIEAMDSYINISDNMTIAQTLEISVNDTRSPLSSMWTMTDSNNATTDVIILQADLDFAEWTVVYSCSILAPNAYRYEVVTAMTRSRTITPELRNYLKALMVGVGFRIGDHHPIHQTNC